MRNHLLGLGNVAQRQEDEDEEEESEWWLLCLCGGRVMRKEWWGPDVATWVGRVKVVWAGSEKDKPVTLPLQTGQCGHWAEGTSMREGEPVWALSGSQSAEKVPLEGSDQGPWTLQQAAPLNLEPQGVHCSYCCCWSKSGRAGAGEGLLPALCSSLAPGSRPLLLCSAWGALLQPHLLVLKLIRL